MNNQELKQYMKKRRIYQWRVAEALEIQESALSKRFRHEIDEEYKKILLLLQVLLMDKTIKCSISL